MKTETIIYVTGGATWLHVKDAAGMYGMSSQSMYRLLDKIESLDRYKSPRIWVSANEGGHRMINSLVLEDYLHYKAQIDAGIKSIPPYDPALVRWNRGEYKITPT